MIDSDAGFLDLQTCFTIAERLDALAEELSRDGQGHVRGARASVDRPPSADAPLLPRELAMIFDLPRTSHGALLLQLLGEPASILSLAEIAETLQCRRDKARGAIYTLRQKLARSGFAKAISCKSGAGYFIETAMANDLIGYARGYRQSFILEDRAIRS